MKAAEKEMAWIKAALAEEGFAFEVTSDAIEIFDCQVPGCPGFRIPVERGRRVLAALAKGKGIAARAISLVLSLVGD